MEKITFLTAELVIEINNQVCIDGGNRHQCYDVGRVESALHSAIYPGQPPFANGTIARVAGAVCYFLTMAHAFFDGNKRTGLLSAITFLNENGLDLAYQANLKTGLTEISILVNDCAAGKVTKEQMMDWFDAHQVEWRSS